MKDCYICYELKQYSKYSMEIEKTDTAIIFHIGDGTDNTEPIIYKLGEDTDTFIADVKNNTTLNNLKKKVILQYFDRLMRSDLVCPMCNSKNLVKNGKRSQKGKPVQQYACNSCGYMGFVYKFKV